MQQGGGVVGRVLGPGTPGRGGGEGDCRGGCLIARWFAGARVVDGDGGADFASIQAAVDAAGDGDTIEMRAMA